MADNTPDQPPGVSGTSGPSTSQVPSTSKRSTRSKLKTKIKGFLSGSKTPSERPTTPTPPSIKASNTIKGQGVGNHASDMLSPGKLLSKRAEKVPRGSAETNDRKIALLDLGIGAINAIRDVTQLTGLAMNQPNPVGQVLEKVTDVLGTLKQMMENRSAWKTLLITLDDHQLVLNRQLALLKKDHLNVDPTSPVLDPIKRYSTSVASDEVHFSALNPPPYSALEEILAAIIKESGLADRNGHGGGRWETVKNFSSEFINTGSEKDQIQGYDRKVSVAMSQLNMALVLYISDKVQEIGDKLVSTEEANVLAKLKITDLECGSPLRGCMEGTRQDVLEKIKEWTKDLDAPNILWLKGHPGVGKSAIATNVVEHLKTSGRLGSGFFFHRQNAAVMTTSLLWCTVAHDLARKYPTIRKRILAALNAHDLGPTTVNVDKLFLHLIHEPMVESETIPEDSLPIIVVDALDECGGLKSRRSEHRRSLMKTLTSWSRLPSKFKLIVTSRSEIDIELVFSATNHRLVEILAGQTVEPQSSKDIQIFITGQLQVQVMNEYASSPPSYGTQVVEDLAERAAGLFIWAETVINFISLGHPQQRLEQVLKGSVTGDMNALYSQILMSSFGQPTKEEINNFCAVVGTIILAKVPLSVLSLQQLLSMDELTVRVVCNGLRSVLDSRDTLRFHHQSFVDFLMDPERSPHQFRFERNRESRNLTLACLQVMKNRLRFNICDMPSSYLRNSDVPDLEARVEECIPPYVSYSSRFWANHLAETVFDIEVFDCLQHFMQNQFLFWLEILSLTKRVNITSSMLLLLVDWIKAGQRDDVMARDMRKFVAGFGGAISQSVPHIYLSALAFSPRNSAVSKQYRPRFSRTIAMKSGGLINWPVMQNVLSEHAGIVLSVTFSPDGTRIISGSSDKTIWVWDAETGEVVTGPLRHGGSVHSVGFSPDGTRIVSGSYDMNIRVWDAETGEVVAGPFIHIEHFTSVAFSPDGAWLVLRSWDKTIRVWDAETGEALAVPFERHSGFVNSVASSRDGTRVVYGSDDKTIWVWDVETGEMVAGPFEGQSIITNSAAISPDGTRIVSGSNSKTIWVWDAETGEVVAGPFNHSEEVASVAFSPDGARLVSGSWDKTIRVWNVEAGVVGAGHVDGHTKTITSIAVSLDGKRIVSSSEDKTIRVWDAKMGEMVAGPFEGHSSIVNSVAISPDGTHVVSGSNDKTILVWDAETGEVVAGPLSHNGTVNSVAICPDGTRIASGSNDKMIRVWDAETGEMVAGPFEGQTSINSIAFSPNGTLIVSAGERKVRVWDVETGEAVKESFEGHSYSITSVAFSLDGTRLISGSWDRTIRVWDTKTGEVVAGPFEGHSDPITSVAFSPDGTYVVSGSQDWTIRVWNVEAGEVVVGPWEVHSSRVRSVKFSPDGKRLVAASGTTIWAWDFLIDDSTYLDYNLPPFARSGMQDGWILGANSELLLWVPPALRDGLCWPHKTLAIGDFIKTTLDLAHFMHGESWSQCKG